MDHVHLKIVRHLLRPVRGGAGGVPIVFAVLLFMASKAGLAGIPLAFILTSWFFKYAYILFDHTVLGFDEPPTLDIQMLNPLDEQRPLAQVAILGLIYLAVNYAQQRLGSTAAISIAAVALLFLPASVAILGLERNLFKAANPVAWVRMVLGLGPMYAVVLAIIAGYSVLIALLGRLALWFPLEIAIFMFCVLSVFSVLGGALYERRNELGLETAVSPERTQERQGMAVPRSLAHHARQRTRGLPMAVFRRRSMGRRALSDSLHSGICRSPAHAQAQRRGTRRGGTTPDRRSRLSPQIGRSDFGHCAHRGERRNASGRANAARGFPHPLCRRPQRRLRRGARPSIRALSAPKPRFARRPVR
jgi:hypothetical protein